MLDKDACKKIGEALAENRSITDVNFNGLYMCFKGLIELVEGLQKSCTVSMLQLSGNNIGPEGASVVACLTTPAPRMERGLLSQVKSRLVKLNLASNAVGCQGAIDIAKAVAEGGTLICLNLANNSIGNMGAGALAAVLKEPQTCLETLNLNSNSIRDEGAESLAEALLTSPALTSLQLASNTIGDRGAACVAGALEVNTMLRSLSLTANNITEEGAMAFVTALEQDARCPLEELGLRFSRVPRPLSARLAEAVRGATVALLTLQGAEEDGSGKTCVHLTTMGGLDVVVEGMSPSSTVEELNRGVAAQPDFSHSRIRLMLPDGEVLREGAASLGEVLAKLARSTDAAAAMKEPLL